MTTILRRMLWLASVAAVLWLGIWRPQAAATPRSQAATTSQTRTNAPVRTAPAGHRVGATPGQKGATDYWLESQTTRLTARYDDATVAVGHRGTDGNFETKLTDRGGVELGRFTVSRVGPEGTGGPLRSRARSGRKPSSGPRWPSKFPALLQPERWTNR